MTEQRDSHREAMAERPPVPSAIESLTDPKEAAKVWPKEIAENPEFVRQLEVRRELNERLDTVLAALPRPDVSLQDVVADGRLSEQQVADLYDSLTPLLEDGSEYQRILLYLPFEFLPDAKWMPQTDALREKAQQFRDTYMATWDQLLGLHDVRANFVDGDIMDFQTRTEDHPRVVKAAHMIPKLMEKGWLAKEDVFALLRDNDSLLVESVKETLPVLVDQGFVEDFDLDLMRIEVDYPRPERTPKLKELTPDSLTSWIGSEFARIDSEEHEGVTDKRAAWIRKDQKRIAVEQAGEMIKTALLDGSLAGNEARALMKTEDVSVQQAFVEGLCGAIDQRGSERDLQAQDLFDDFQSDLIGLWTRGPSELRDALAKTLFHASDLGVMSEAQLGTIGLQMPKLAGPFTENVRRLKPEMKEIVRIAEVLDKHPELSKFVYPVVITFGSRLKGYGAEKSDLDVGVFVKPDMDPGDIGTMRTHLQEVLGHESIGGEAVEFWTIPDGDELRVKDFDEFDPSVGESTWAYVLFGAVWEGDEGVIKEIQEKLLAPYFFDEGREYDGMDMRALCIEEMERDTLQYRLMHKGYERFHPRYGGVDSKNKETIDGDSMFWDSGYRQTATKLYASRVFLPKLER